ncbi:MAG TPA: hypothetical protein PL001_04255 [Candidatus Kryptobacter bacterium]|nr:hypothetical protein [Candidatus Kryptobacter bacterium]
MIRNCIFIFSLIVMCAATTVQSQTLGGTICPDNLSYGATYLHSNAGGNLFRGAVSPFAARQGAIAAPEYSPVLMNATSLGAGMVGSVPLHNNIFLRISIINLFSPVTRTFGSVPESQGILMPVQVGIRVPFLRSTLGTLGYSLYGESSAGLLFGWAYPTNGSFLDYSLPNSRFTSGASAYVGVGNSLRIDKFVGLYLNGGVGYYDLFSASFMPQTRYVVPSVSVGFLFSFMQ